METEKKKYRLRKVLLIVFGCIFGLLLLVILFLSPIVKYLVEKYDEQYTGRQITMDWAYVNPLTGYIHFDDFVFHEYKSDSSFLKCSGLSAHFNLRKLWSKEYEVQDLTLTNLKVVVIQHKKDIYNFTDIVRKFSKKPGDPDKDTTPVHFNLLDIKIKNGVFVMHEEMTPVNYSIKNVNFESTGLRWNADTINNKFSFDSGIGQGHIEGYFNIDNKKKQYKTHVKIKKLDMKIIEQYMRDMANYGTVRAFIDLDIKAQGSLKEGRNVDAGGSLSISDFHFGKSPKEDFASFEKFAISINKLNPLKKKYLFDSVSLVHPFAKYEKYDRLDNIQNMFGAKGENVKKTAQNQEKFNLVIEIARYVKKISMNFFHSDYKVNRIGIYRADFRYYDYSINEKFAIAANPLTIVADSVNSNRKRVRVALTSGIKPYGNLDITLSINPKDSSDFELNYYLQKVNTTVLNPYLVTASSYPLDRGSVEFKGHWDVKNGAIRSNNHILVIDPRIGERININRNKWLPMKVFMFFVRERGNAIDYQVPITGNLKDPKFNVWDVLLDIVTNIFIKPPTTPYHYEVKTVENNIEKTLECNWMLRSAKLVDDEEKFVKKVVDFLKKNPGANILVKPYVYRDKEREYIAFFEAKKKYYLSNRNLAVLSEADSVNVEKLSVKDSVFVKYVKAKVPDKMMFTMQERCAALVGAKSIARKYHALLTSREEVFKKYFKDEGVDQRVELQKPESTVPFNGFSYYHISYKGDLPAETKEAYERLKELDSKQPRRPYTDERKKTRRFFGKDK